jgi:carboxypeptidase T
MKLGRAALLVGSVALGLAPATVQPDSAGPSGSTARDERLRAVRIFYTDRADLLDLTRRLEVATVNLEARYVLAVVEPAELAALRAEGWRLEVDQAETDGLNALLPACYRSVERLEEDLQGWADSYPALTELTDIGNSWEKATPGGNAGYDLWMVRLTNEAIPGPKPRFFLMANIHGREVATAESAMDLIRYLLREYGRNSDATWLLDSREIYVVPMVNPDGHKKSEAGLSWRKNTNNTNGCNNPSAWGTDLNRNYDTNFGGPGSGNTPCSGTYHGPSAESEPETRAIADTMRVLFPTRQDASGVMITLHSFAEYVVWPWGNGYNTDFGLLPEDKPGLEALGHKFASINGYLSIMGDDWYPAAGATEDWSYEELDLAGYTFEIGNTFTPSCTALENIKAENRPAYLYAAKVAGPDPYEVTRGPEINGATATPTRVRAGEPVRIDATADDSDTGWVPDVQFPQIDPDRNLPVSAAKVYVDTPPWAGGTPLAMAAADGAFDESQEAVRVMVPTNGLAHGGHVVYIQGVDLKGHAGAVTATQFTVR